MAKMLSIPKKPATRRIRPTLVHQFLIVLTGIEPLVWRRIQVPAAYSFWDLHVAIQDAMGGSTTTSTSFVYSTLKSRASCPSAFLPTTTRRIAR
jgi:hypothetical protein